MFLRGGNCRPLIVVGEMAKWLYYKDGKLPHALVECELTSHLIKASVLIKLCLKHNAGLINAALKHQSVFHLQQHLSCNHNS